MDPKSAGRKVAYKIIVDRLEKGALGAIVLASLEALISQVGPFRVHYEAQLEDIVLGCARIVPTRLQTIDKHEGAAEWRPLLIAIHFHNIDNHRQTSQLLSHES